MAVVSKDNMFGVAIPANDRCIAEIRKVQRRKWDAKNKIWWFHIDEFFRVAAIVKQFFPLIAERLYTSPRFADVRKVVGEQKQLLAASYAANSSIDVPVPPGMAYRPFQLAGIEYACTLYKRNPSGGVLIGDDMGLGKTVQAIGFINTLRDYKQYMLKTLIICPSSLKRNWQRECNRWFAKKSSIVLMESGMDAYAVRQGQVIIINYDILNKYFDELYRINWNVIVFDEAQYIKNATTKRSTAARALATRDHSFVVALSGTAMENRPTELWHLLHVIDQRTWGSFSKFKARYTSVNGTSSRGKNLKELSIRLRSSCMIRRTKNEVLTELPPYVMQVVEIGKKGFESVLANEAPVRASYEAMEDKIEKLEGAIVEAVRQQNKANADEYRAKIAAIRSGKLGQLSEISKIRHQTALAKLPKCLEFITDVLENKDKVVIFAHHRDVVDKIYDMFPGISVKLQGGMTDDEKDNSVQAFINDPKIKIFVLSTLAGGVGLTLTVADTCIFCELDWTPSKNEQAFSRLHRMGQKSVVFVYHLVLEDSIDANIAKKCVDKQKEIDIVMS